MQSFWSLHWGVLLQDSSYRIVHEAGESTVSMFLVLGAIPVWPILAADTMTSVPSFAFNMHTVSVYLYTRSISGDSKSDYTFHPELTSSPMLALEHPTRLVLTHAWSLHGHPTHVTVFHMTNKYRDMIHIMIDTYTMAMHTEWVCMKWTLFHFCNVSVPQGLV